ncbi:hypothetical protein SAMN05446037_100473 [Anaerovirgula multivorans]|uniref:DUF1850 domain-containing protein n=1 Tax=Anaerovirgula multivorans TaxID=312168 RepID=A0A239BSU1_9FIRM|nr:DUF1850 domain-containing protein [Anaerovirgula multivorans]SNS10114.1 hypothetical protein SAMN05446037_100473 [Anaerovirgula multivorans]
MKKKYWIYLVLLLTVLLYSYPVTLLQVVDGVKKDQILYQAFAKPHDRFTVQWVHSVSKQPVIETYQINSDFTISIYEMLFNENGPNLPSGPENGTKWEIKNGMFRVYNYDIIFDEVPVRIGQVIANHTLIYKNDIVELKNISRPGGFVTIRACKIPLIKYMHKEVKLWLKIK